MHCVGTGVLRQGVTLTETAKAGVRDMTTGTAACTAACKAGTLAAMHLECYGLLQVRQRLPVLQQTRPPQSTS